MLEDNSKLIVAFNFVNIETLQIDNIIGKFWFLRIKHKYSSFNVF